MYRGAAPADGGDGGDGDGQDYSADDFPDDEDAGGGDGEGVIDAEFEESP
jgi:hypothetical protein